MAGVEDTQNTRRKLHAPHSDRNPIPTIQHYRQEKEERKENAIADDDDVSDEQPSRTQQTIDVYKDWREAKRGNQKTDAQDVYKTENKNAKDDRDGAEEQDSQAEETPASTEDEGGTEDDSHVVEDTSQVAGGAHQDPKARRKTMKKRGGERAEREVTDPVTHLPVTIHDFTRKDLKNTPENEPAPGSNSRTATGLTAATKSTEHLKSEGEEVEAIHAGMKSLFPPPEFDEVRRDVARVYRTALTAGLAVVLLVSVGLILLEKVFEVSSRIESLVLRRESSGKSFSSLILLLLGTGLGSLIVWGLGGWTEKKIQSIWECQVWEADRQEGKKRAKSSETPETVQWLNSLVGNIWPIVNPDLFTSLADTLEDVMQASLPRLVRMISVEDIGQGSESIRILGVKWLPTAAAGKSVSEDGKLENKKDNKNDRSVEGQGSVDKSSPSDDQDNEDEESKDQRKEKEQSAENVAEGMEAEEGDFVNMEIAFAYRARKQGRGMRARVKNAHLYLAFYLPSNIKLPVWVELQGLVGIVRLRLQLTPDPPFFSLCTLTFMGQPKVDLACVPLTKKGLNIMDLPLISNFVQSAVDAAMAEYVAPKSLTVDLKDMLMGDDFKKDTVARGVLIVRIKRAFDFKEGDMGTPFKDGSADPYVTVGWAKFGKPVWSTRIILTEMKPYWEETAFVLVTPQELNVDERIRLQLWDSDRTTADDDLGRIEVDLKEIMRDSRSNGKMWDRADGFKALKAGEGMPGQLEWSVGYYSKTRILDSQLAEQTEDPDVKNIGQLKKKVYDQSERKLREAKKDESAEIEQQKAQDLKARQDELMIASPPPAEFPSGILSIQIHQVVGLELEAINSNKHKKEEETVDEQEEGDDLPSGYCNIMINHQKVYRTRTKPKNGKPFYNAGCERFIRDWQTTDLHISVRDARVHENDPLLGVVYIQLGKIFAKRSQVSDFYPLAGGIGFGKMRVSLLFRAVHLQVPRPMLGWEYGTIEVQPTIRAVDVPEELRKLRIKARTSLGRKKLYADKGDGWAAKKGQPIRLAVRKRYNNAFIIEFRKDSKLIDKTPAWCVLWLKDVTDEEDETFTLPIYKGDLKRATTCTMDEPGEKVGAIEVKLKFWRGLSGYHDKLKSKDRNLADVMEVLDVTNDSINENGYDDPNASSGTEADSSDDEAENGHAEDDEQGSLSEDGRRGPISQAKDYLENAGQLHRKHRGLMQWKAPRTINWMKTKVEHGGQKISNMVQHSERDNGIETEV